MPSPPRRSKRAAEVPPHASLAARVEEVRSALERLGSTKHREGLARFALPTDRAFGVTVPALRSLAKSLGHDHELALAIWKDGWLETRMLAALIDDPARVTIAQMDQWCAEFDNWGVCDTVCFHLFDRTPHAWRMVPKWAKRKEEFRKRAAFALLWSLSVHDKRATDERFEEGLEFIEAAANDDRNFVKKAVNMALRAIGKRNAALNGSAIVVATRLAESNDATARWNGKDALRELKSASVTRRLLRKSAKS